MSEQPKPIDWRMEVQLKMWWCLPETICHLQRAKRECCWCHRSNERHGLNYTLVVIATCFLEGLLESGLADLMETNRTTLPPIDSLPSALQKKLRNRVGLNHYDGMLEMLTGSGFSDRKGVAPFVEALNILFDLRNVFAHGREATFAWIGQSLPDGSPSLSNKMLPEGAYQKVRAYLLKKKLLSAEDAKGVTTHNFLKDEVAEHFVVVAIDAIEATLRSLTPEQLDTFEKGTGKVEMLGKLRAAFLELSPGNPMSTATKVSVLPPCFLRNGLVLQEVDPRIREDLRLS